MNEEKRKPGRPPQYETVAEMQNRIDAYFDKCDENKEPYTVTGLALALGFTTRQALLNYEGKEEFVDAVKKAKLRCEFHAEKSLFNGKNAGGSIFALKNYGWVDRQEIVQTEKPVIKISRNKNDQDEQ